MVKLSFSAQIALATLDMEVAATKGESIKKSTKKNIACYLGAYQRFCDRYLLHYFPCDNRQLCRFGQHLSKTLESPESVGNYISGIRTCHALLGLEVPSTQDRQMQMFNTGIKRLMPHEVKQAEPITPGILLRLSKVVDYKDQVEVIAWVGALLGFYMFLRRSNLVPEAMDKFDPQYQFTRADVNITSIHTAMMFEIRWSKTIQYRQRVLRLPVLPAANKAICPVFWVFQLLRVSPAGPTQPLLAIRHKGEIVSLSAYQLLSRLRKWLKLINLDDMKFTLHSLRRGGATFAYESNMEEDMIKLLGDWSSQAYRRYIDVSMEKRFNSMKEFVDALNRMTC